MFVTAPPQAVGLPWCWAMSPTAAVSVCRHLAYRLDGVQCLCVAASLGTRGAAAAGPGRQQLSSLLSRQQHLGNAPAQYPSARQTATDAHLSSHLNSKHAVQMLVCCARASNKRLSCGHQCTLAEACRSQSLCHAGPTVCVRALPARQLLHPRAL